MGSQKKKNRQSSRKPVKSLPKKRFPIFRVSLIIVVVVGAVLLVMANFRPTPQGQAAKSDTQMQKAQSAPVSDKTAGFENLIGRWLRPDGGYILEIRNIGANGRMDAAYLNPRPINIARAEASWKQGKQAVFIELQDTGYPGSTYTLDYNPDQDVFTGIYFQAVIKKGFEVVFVRQN